MNQASISSALRLEPAVVAPARRCGRLRSWFDGACHCANASSWPSMNFCLQARRRIFPLDVVGIRSRSTRSTACGWISCSAVIAVRIPPITFSVSASVICSRSISCTTISCSGPVSGVTEKTAPRPFSRPDWVSCTVNSMSLG